MIFGLLIGLVIGAIFSAPILRAIGRAMYVIKGRDSDSADYAERWVKRWRRDDE